MRRKYTYWFYINQKTFKKKYIAFCTVGAHSTIRDVVGDKYISLDYLLRENTFKPALQRVISGNIYIFCDLAKNWSKSASIIRVKFLNQAQSNFPKNKKTWKKGQ